MLRRCSCSMNGRAKRSDCPGRFLGTPSIHTSDVSQYRPIRYLLRPELRHLSRASSRHPLHNLVAEKEHAKKGVGLGRGITLVECGNKLLPVDCNPWHKRRVRLERGYAIREEDLLQARALVYTCLKLWQALFNHVVAEVSDAAVNYVRGIVYVFMHAMNMHVMRVVILNA